MILFGKKKKKDNDDPLDFFDSSSEANSQNIDFYSSDSTRKNKKDNAKNSASSFYSINENTTTFSSSFYGDKKGEDENIKDRKFIRIVKYIVYSIEAFLLALFLHYLIQYLNLK